MESVSIVIVNWNTGKLLAQCLESLGNLPERENVRHIIIVDNASTDTSIPQAQATADRAGFTILLKDTNFGFAKANNIGIQYVQEHEGADDHILLLNPDTIVHPHAIEHMISVFSRDTTIGIVGPKLLEATREVQPSVRSFPTLPIFVLLFLKLHRLFLDASVWKRYMQPNFDYTNEQPVDQVMGAAFLIRNTLIHTVGLLDEEFWIWFEEVDYCKRAKDAGFKVLYTPSATITHYKGTSFNQLLGWKKTKPLLVSALRYAKKHLGIGAYIVLCILYPVALMIALLASFDHAKQREQNNKKL